jgi:hypothetical protein
VTASEEKRTKRQILVLFDFSKTSENALLHGIRLSLVLKSSLTIVFPFIQSMKNEERNQLKQSLAMRIAQISRETHIEIQAFAPDKSIQSFYRPLYEKVEGIMYVLGIEGRKFACGIGMNLFLKMVRNSKIPWLTVPPEAPVNNYTHVVLPLSYNRQVKEKIAWASYFHRLNHSAIHALVPKAKDGFIKIGIFKNTEFLKKMYTSLEIYYKLILTEKNIHDIDEYALNYALIHNAAPVIILVTPRPDIFDLLFGAKERKLIQNNKQIPLLCINPLDDMYVVCS